MFMRPLGGEVSLWVAASPEKVWALVGDVSRIGEFSPETFEARWNRGSTRPVVGATFKGHVRRNGVGPTYWAPCQVSRCVPNEHFEFVVGTGSVAVNNWGYRLQAQDGGTLVTEYFRLESSIYLRAYWAVMGRLRGRTNERGMRTTLERMKAAVEA
jgi:uncharacterized protein YndB with AHSA1/START domain